MKIGGRPVKGLHECLLVLRDGEDAIAIRARAIPSFDEFNAMCPEPKPPQVFGKNGYEPDLKDANYRQVKAIYDERMMSYIHIKSLEASEIEWDKVDINNPGTWAGWRQDMLDGGLSPMEVNRISGIVLEANSLDDAKIAAAREVFLKGQRQPGSESSSPSAAQASTSSGEPANASA
jgi:hypothetical protein